VLCIGRKGLRCRWMVPDACDNCLVGINHRQVQFRADDLGEVIQELDGIAARANGREWITFSPWVDPEHLPVVSVLRRIFSGRGSKVPEVTWVASHDDEPSQVGFLHAVGANADQYLRDGGAPMPDSWVKMSDHSKRGLLLAVHPDATARQVITYVIQAATVLAQVPTDDRWLAQVSTLDS